MSTAASTCDKASQEAPSNGQRVGIQDILARRSDLSTFVVHLTRDGDHESAKERLESIVRSWQIEARSAFGSAVKRLADENLRTDSQKCVCFTETPLEYLHLLLGEIKGRNCQFGPYGVAVTKKLARKNGVNPVWYVDMTPRDAPNWLTNYVDKLIEAAIKTSDFAGQPFVKIAPFIEQMGTWPKNGSRKEFWWEREWRRVGDFELPRHAILICPDENGNHKAFEELAKDSGHSVKCIDPYWGLEQIIARLAGFGKEEVEIL
jgi:hypothetical protein